MSNQFLPKFYSLTHFNVIKIDHKFHLFRQVSFMLLLALVYVKAMWFMYVIGVCSEIFFWYWKWNVLHLHFIYRDTQNNSFTVWFVEKCNLQWILIILLCFKFNEITSSSYTTKSSLLYIMCMAFIFYFLKKFSITVLSMSDKCGKCVFSCGMR